MKKTYIDLHTHTLRSDGAYTPVELVARAREAGIGILALTEHNHTDDLSGLQAMFPEVRLIQGAEIGCMYTDSRGKEVEIHVVALGFDPEHPAIRAVLANNDPDRRPYINAILDRLRLCGIDLGDYEDMSRRFPDSRQIGRMNIAKCMKELGYVETVDEGFDLYIGSFGERRAFVPNPTRYVSMEEAVSAIAASGGVAVLAHLYYYGMDDRENLRLVETFKALAGEHGGMEVYYERYDREQREALRDIADRYGLMYSAASDFHGQREKDTLENRFLSTDCQALLNRLGLGEEHD